MTFHGNLFQDIIQRAPRVRYGQAHVYNNYYVGSKSHTVYPHIYSIGLGGGSRVISEDNVFEIRGADSVCDMAKSYGGVSFAELRSLLNGAPMKTDLACRTMKGDSAFEAPGWQLPYRYAPISAADVAVTVKASVGPQWPAFVIALVHECERILRIPGTVSQGGRVHCLHHGLLHC